MQRIFLPNYWHGSFHYSPFFCRSYLGELSPSRTPHSRISNISLQMKFRIFCHQIQILKQISNKKQLWKIFLRLIWEFYSKKTKKEIFRFFWYTCLIRTPPCPKSDPPEKNDKNVFSKLLISVFYVFGSSEINFHGPETLECDPSQLQLVFDRKIERFLFFFKKS